jgi:hypothetical protein
MVIAWLPNEGVLFQGDLVNHDVNGNLYPALGLLQSLMQPLKTLGIPVKTIVGVHSIMMSYDQLCGIERSLQ